MQRTDSDHVHLARAIERVGYPRNLVFTKTTRATFDREVFDADVRAGHMVGSNGPVLQVTVDDGSGPCPDWAIPYEDAASSGGKRMNVRATP